MIGLYKYRAYSTKNDLNKKKKRSTLQVTSVEGKVSPNPFLENTHTHTHTNCHHHHYHCRHQHHHPPTRHWQTQIVHVCIVGVDGMITRLQLTQRQHRGFPKWFIRNDSISQELGFLRRTLNSQGHIKVCWSYVLKKNHLKKPSLSRKERRKKRIHCSPW